MTDLNWFQVGPIPQDVITGHYNLSLVALSYAIAVLASYVALDLVGRLREEKNPSATLYWLVGGAFTMGAGIWSMHFIGMLSFIMPMPMGYDLGWTFGSLLVAILVSALALFILRKNEYSVTKLAIGGVCIGLGIVCMHYSGMQGMKEYTQIHYLPGLFLLSIVIAIFAAEAALWLALKSNRGSSQRQFNLKIISALIMGVAICGMHYTGMYAAVFTPLSGSIMNMLGNNIPPYLLAIFIAGMTALIISLALTVSTYYKQMIRAAQNEKNFLNAMLDNLEDGIIACDQNGKITVINDMVEKNIRHRQVSKTIEDLVSNFMLYTHTNKPLAATDYPLIRALNGERIHGMELITRPNDGIDREVVVDGQQIIDADGRKLGAVMVVHDVTELKKTETLKNEFVSIVSHELRTPLTSIRGALGLLVGGTLGDFPEKAKNLLDIANNNCERLLLLINDILDVEKIEAGKMQFHLKVVNLKQLVSESVDVNKMYGDKFGVLLQLAQPVVDVNVVVDPDRLMQVLANLISNAIKFSSRGEQVTLNMQQIENNKVRISVSDKGQGISQEFQGRIFQKFSQADSSSTRGKGGTGLGLNISKSIIEKLGGKLNFRSVLNEGTTFYIDLPVCEEDVVGTSSKVDQLPADKKRLLVCEDDEDQAKYLGALLESSGFVVDLAYTVAQAKDFLREHEYQALLLDLILPDQDGVAFIRELRADEGSRELPVIVMSVIAQTGRSILNGDAFSVVDWLDKPIDFHRLLVAISHIKAKNPKKMPDILHVEDDVDTQHILGTLLQEHANVRSAGTLEQAKKMLEKDSYDLVILDLALPDGNSVEIMPLIAKKKLPILVFSATELDHQYIKYVSQALIKSNSSTEKLLDTIMGILNTTC